MANTQKITVTMPVEAVEAVRRLVTEGKTDSVSGFVRHAVQVSLDDRRLGALGQPVRLDDPEGIVADPRGEPAEVSIDPDSGLPALTLGRPVTSDEVAEALDDE